MSSILDRKLQEAIACFNAHDWVGAERACGEILTQLPRHPTALHLLGVVRMVSGRPLEAALLIGQALEVSPRDAAMQENLGMARAALGDYVAAETAFRKALDLGAVHAQLHMRLGMALAAQGRLAEAEPVLRLAAGHAPGDAEVQVNLGNALAELGQSEEALASYNKALATNPRHPLASYNLGTLLLRLNRLDEAEAALRSARAVAPADPGVCFNLGAVLERKGRLDLAEACYRDAVALDPHNADAWFHAGEMCKQQGRLDDAIAAYEQALALRPDFYAALSALAHQRQHLCVWGGIEELWDRLRQEAIGKPGTKVPPFDVLSFTTSPQEQLACATAWSATQFAPYAAERARPRYEFPQRAQARLRVGYLSWDYHRHATTTLIAELFELHDRDRFEIFAYDYGPDDGSEIRRRIRDAAEHFNVVRDDTITGAAQRISSDGIDVLVDLKGYTQGSMTEVLMLRPAPVQVNWLGYPGTMGNACIDYIIADAFIIPDGAERYYSERVVRLPGCYQVNDRRREVSERIPARAGCGLPDAGVVLCCFNHSYKILPEMFGVWMRIMRSVPDSVLWLLESNRWAPENLRREAAARGVEPNRLVFAPKVASAEHLARYHLADLCVDTFPYTSHTTASDALWVGCPLASCAGDTFASRVAGSILINAGMRDLVVDTLDDYERLVIRLAWSRQELKDMRRRLQEGRDKCPLFDTPRFVKGLEEAYEMMIRAPRTPQA